MYNSLAMGGGGRVYVPLKCKSLERKLVYGEISGGGEAPYMGDAGGGA